MTRLFGRELKVTIQEKSQVVYVWKNQRDISDAYINAMDRKAGVKNVPADPEKVAIAYSSNSGGGRSYEYKNGKGFKISVSVDRVSSAQTPDSAVVKIWNAKDFPVLNSTDTRKLYLTITGGYAGLTGLLYAGDIILTDWGRDGADMIYTVQAGDGESLNRFEQFSQNTVHAPNTNISGVLNDMINAFLKDGTQIVSDLKDKILAMFKGEKFTVKNIVKGDNLKKIEKILNKKGYQLVSTNGVLDLRKFYTATNDPAIVLSPATGLIGSPKKKRVQRMVNQKSVIKEGIDFECLLIPGLFPGRKIKVDSEFIKGFFVIETVNYNADTFDEGIWTATGEAIQL